MERTARTAIYTAAASSTGMSTKRVVFVPHSTRTEATDATDEITATLLFVPSVLPTNSAARPEILGTQSLAVAFTNVYMTSRLSDDNKNKLVLERAEGKAAAVAVAVLAIVAM